MENSIVSLKIQKRVLHPLSSSRKSEKGTGFIIDIEKGLVVTHSDCVQDAVSILGKISFLGRREFSLELLGICIEKEVAICKILNLESFLSQIPNKTNLSFGDSMKIGMGSSTKSLGYSNDIFMVIPGTIRGFERKYFNIEDSYSRGPSYLFVNGNYENFIGAPLLNSDNKVIGIHSRISGNVIPARTFLAIYSELLTSSELKLPTLGLEWCSTNRELMKLKTGSSSTYGIYVRKCYPDSCFDLLEKGDIIRRLDYVDKFWDETIVTVFFDRFGMAHRIGKLKDLDEPDPDKISFEKIYTEQKLTLSELMDMVPFGSELSLNICRDGTWYKLKTKYVPIGEEKVERQNLEYEFFAGLFVSNLDIVHLKQYPGLDKYKKQVLITFVFPESEAGKISVLKKGQVIKSILGYDANFELIKESHRAITSLNDVKHVLHLRPYFIQITTIDDFTYVTSLETMMSEDKKILEKNCLKKKYILD